jgi:hypothetical protein
MELIVIIIISTILAGILSIVFNIDFKKVKEIGMEERLNKLSEKYPSNIEICKDILKKIKNEEVEIEEDKDASTTLYIAATNKIFIADTKNSYTRIQTMAHECLHSIQDRKVLMFNFIFSNVYMIYFAIIILLTIFKILTNSLLYLNIFLLLSMVYYMVRAFLENDAMIKAKYLAKEYMQEKNISNKEEIEEIVDGFTRLNDAGIKVVNYQLFLQILIKVIIFSIVALIF